jgi:spermidine/putrescine transport system substrate-binding protein
MFKEATGVSVTYTEDVNDEQRVLREVRTQLEQGQPIGRDIVVLTDWMAALWIANGYAQKFDKALMPNAADLIPKLQGVAFDPIATTHCPGNPASGPWAGTRPSKEAIGTDTMTSVDQLRDPALKGRITVLSEMRDTMGILMAWQGNDPSNFTEDQFNQALEALTQQVDSGQIRQVTGNDYAGALESGDVIAVIGWSGDMIQLGDEFGVALPETGGMLWTDNMLIPPLAAHKKNAEQLMNFYYDPEIAAMVAAVRAVHLAGGAGRRRQWRRSIRPWSTTSGSSPRPRRWTTPTVFMTLTFEQDEAYQQGLPEGDRQLTMATRAVEDLHLAGLTKRFGEMVGSTT